MDRKKSQNLNNDTFYRPRAINAHVVIGTEMYPDNRLLLNYDDDNYSQGYGQIKEAFKALTQDDIVQPYKSELDFRSFNECDTIGYGLYAFDIRYQKDFESAQPIKVEIKFDGSIPDEIYDYALVLTNRLVNISSDRQRMFDLL